MKLPFWILAILIFISIAFAGYASYKLYEGKAIDKSGANQVFSNAIDAVPSVRSKGGLMSLTVPEKIDEIAIATNQEQIEQAKLQPVEQKSLERNARKIGIQKDIEETIDEGKRVLKKIGDIAVIAGEARKIALVG